jgi:hypothetical protein
MSYRCGIGEGMVALGLEPGPPRITCDQCGEVMAVKYGMPPAWLLNGKAPRGWRSVALKDGTRRDFCPSCIRTP